MNLYEAVVLGIIEGITEYLPISSTGHLILASAMLGLDEPAETKRAVDAFNIVIQGGAILAVALLYWPRIVQMIRGLVGRDRIGLRLAINIIVAFLPAAIVGLLLHDWIEVLLFWPIPVIAALAVGGVLMLFVGHWQRRFFSGDEHASPADAHQYVDLEHLTWRRALLIGCCQCLALWPGASRSMVTIVGGMLAGMRPRQSAEFSFLLGLPTLGGACVLTAAKSIAGDEPSLIETLGWAPLLVGFVVATIAAALAVRWLVSYLNRHSLALFGWYRIGLSIIVAAMIVAGVLEIVPVPSQ